MPRSFTLNCFSYQCNHSILETLLGILPIFTLHAWTYSSKMGVLIFPFLEFSQNVLLISSGDTADQRILQLGYNLSARIL